MAKKKAPVTTEIEQPVTAEPVQEQSEVSKPIKPFNQVKQFPLTALL